MTEWIHKKHNEWKDTDKLTAIATYTQNHTYK